MRRETNDRTTRQARTGAKLGHKFCGVVSAHAQVDDYRIGQKCDRSSDRTARRALNTNRMANALKNCSDRPSEKRVFLDDENPALLRMTHGELLLRPPRRVKQ